MITNESAAEEIEDLQRLLISLKLLTWGSGSVSGTWGDETQLAVQAAYRRLGWSHPIAGQWISAPALAVLAADWSAGRSSVRGSGTNMGVDGVEGSGTNMGVDGVEGSGTNMGAEGVEGSGTNMGGSGTNMGGSGTNMGGSGTNMGESADAEG